MIPVQTEKSPAFYHKYKSFSAHCMRIIDWKLLCNYVLSRCSSFPCFCCLLLFVQLLLWSPSILQLGGKGCTCSENEQCVLLVLNTTGKLRHISPNNIIRMIFYIWYVCPKSNSSLAPLLPCLSSLAFRNQWVPWHFFSNYAICL